MKHLFYIHSGITYLVSLKVIEHNKLDKAACVLLLGRGFEPPLPADVPAVVLPFSHFPINSFAVQRKFWESWKKLRAFDAFVQSITNGESFHLYTNQTGLDFIRLFISHKGCAGFSYLEEGLYSYYTIDEVNNRICPSGHATAFYKFLKNLNFFGRLSGNPRFFAEGYKATYGLCKESFPGFRNRIILDDGFSTVYAKCSINGHVLALDALYEYGHIPKAAFEKALKKAFLYFKEQQLEKIWVKFHPEQHANAQFLADIRKMIANCKNDVEVKELPQNYSLELMAADQTKHVDFYVFLSSVGLYAGLAGRQVYSFARFIGDQDEKYQTRIAALPEVYGKYVKFL